MGDSIEKTVELRATVARVWRAITDPSEFGRWFGVKLDGVFVVGETKRGPVTYPGFEHVTWEATIERIEAPRLFVFTWHPYAIDPAIDYTGETPTRVEFHLRRAGGGTRLIIKESGFDSLPDGRRVDAMRMNDSGWSEQLINISRHVGG